MDGGKIKHGRRYFSIILRIYLNNILKNLKIRRNSSRNHHKEEG